MNVLVVGASGFLGRATCMELLRAGHAVSGTWRAHPERLPEGLADSLEETELETRRIDAEVVIACSARIPYGAMNRPDPELNEANIRMPLRLSHRFPKSRLDLAGEVTPRRERHDNVGETRGSRLPDQAGQGRLGPTQAQAGDDMHDKDRLRRRAGRVVHS